MLPNSWYKKEKPLPTMIGMGGGATSLVNSTAGGAGVDAPQGHEASGGVISHYYDPSSKALYRSHTFSAPGTFTISSLSGTYPAEVDWLLVGSGGGGGQQHSGGGGGGGFLTNDAEPVSATSYPITIGAWGKGDNAPPSGPGGTNGEDSTAFGARAAGGGGGASASPSNLQGLAGGSGGGGGNGPSGGSGGNGGIYPNSSTTPAPLQGQAAPGQGYAGGASSGWSTGGGSAGGGGAGGTGTSGPGAPTNPMAQSPGGIGRTDPNAQYYQWGPTSPRTYGGGGGGGGHGGGLFFGGAGGPGGGGDGGWNPANSPSPRGGDNSEGRQGAPGQGGGGGGCEGGAIPGNDLGGPGGAGVCVVRYQIGTLAPGAKATGGSISYYDGKYIHTFTNPGTFVTNAGFNETIEYVVLGGGGGGGYQNGGGGGAGGYTTGTTPFSTPTSTSMAMYVGFGGYTSWGPPTSPFGAMQFMLGEDSTAAFPSGTITAGGGGFGGAEPSASLPDAYSNLSPFTLLGSGGGSGRGYPGPASPGTTGGPQGNDGGSSVPGGSIQNGGGGGGAGGAGANAQPTKGGGGGIGVQLPATFRDPKSGVGYPGPGGSGFWVAGGGGGGSGWGAPAAGGGGAGPGTPTAGPTTFVNYAGAGDGRDAGTPQTGGNSGDNGCRRDGFANSGSGGGGGSDASPQVTKNVGGDGGPGIILIAYPA